MNKHFIKTRKISYIGPFYKEIYRADIGTPYVTYRSDIYGWLGHDTSNDASPHEIVAYSHWMLQDKTQGYN